MKTELLVAYAAINPRLVVYADWNMNATSSPLWVRSMHYTVFIYLNAPGDTSREP